MCGKDRRLAGKSLRVTGRDIRQGGKTCGKWEMAETIRKQAVSRRKAHQPPKYPEASVGQAARLPPLLPDDSPDLPFPLARPKAAT